MPAGEHVLDDASRAEAAHVNQRQRQMAAMATRARGETESVAMPSGIDTNGVRDPRGGNETPEVVGHGNRAGRNGPREAGDERRPAGQESGERSVRRAQIDVLAAGTRPERGEFRVRHGARECQQSAGEPHRQHADGMRYNLRDDAGAREDADADDVGDHDRRRIERAEASIQLLRRSIRFRGHAAL